MNEQEFLAHHGLFRNPFADEDAQTDIVFKDYCIGSTYHPAWSKVYGDPREPATSIVFGPKGAGKTALRLQIAKRLKQYNQEQPNQRVFVIQYDDFNGNLGQLQQRLSSWHRDRPEKVLDAVRLWDHMDGMLCLGVTQLVDSLLQTHARDQELDDSFASDRLTKLDRDQRRDLLVLAACYDQSKSGTYRDRWLRLKRTLRFHPPAPYIDFLGGLIGSLLLVILFATLFFQGSLSLKTSFWMTLLFGTIAWSPWLWRYARNLGRAYGMTKHMRFVRRDLFALTNLLQHFPSKDLAGQPLPHAPRTDDRYALLEKFQGLLRTLGFHGVIVLVDRIDEPDIVNGKSEYMKRLVWPLLDNKLLKHQGLGIKLLLPSDLEGHIDRESREFHERARLDKQNLNRSFDWTGEALYDVVMARMRGCSSSDKPSTITDMLDAGISEQRLLQAFQSLKTPRSLFRFLYKLVTEHCKRYRSLDPQFKITSEVFESTLALHLNDLQRTATLG